MPSRDLGPSEWTVSWLREQAWLGASAVTMSAVLHSLFAEVCPA